MNTSTMRSIDRRLGGPLCALLTLVRRLTGPWRAGPPPSPRRILVVKLAEQGAWVVAHDAIARAVELVGADNVFLMTFDENRFVLDQLGLVPAHQVIVVRTTSALRVALDALAGVRRARREGVDTALDFEFFARSSAILCFLSGASRRVGFHASAGEAAYRGDLMTHRLVYNPRLHVAETFRCIGDAAQLPADRLPALDVPAAEPGPPPLVAIQDDERSALTSRLGARLGPGPLPPIVLLNANAGDLLPLRRWPSARYVELARRLLADDDEVAIVFTGSPDEAAESRRLAAEVGSRRCISMGGETTLRELLVLYALAEVLVTNDSGPAHYAALTPVDVVTLFGPESPHVFGSLSRRHHAVWAALPCSPCVNAFNDRTTPCRDNLCMQHISVDQVHDLVVGIRARRRGTGAEVGTAVDVGTRPSPVVHRAG